MLKFLKILAIFCFTGFTKNSRLLTTDVISGLMSLEGKYTFDVIFMDPPYRKELEKDVLVYLSRSSIVKSDSRIIVESALDTDFSYVESLGFSLQRVKEYKTNKHVFLRRSYEDSRLSGQF